MRHINETTGQIPGIGRLQRRIGKTFTCTVRRDEVFQHRKALFEVRQNRVLDDLTTFGAGLLRFGHKTTHTGKLTNLLFRTTGSRVKHHEYGVESLIIGRQLFHENIGKFRVDVRPCIDNLIIAFIIGNESHVIVGHNLFDVGISLIDESLFFSRNNHIGKIERKTTLEGHLVTEVLDVIEELSRTNHTANFDNITDDIPQRFFCKNLVDISNLFGNELIDKNTSYRGFAQNFYKITVLIEVLYTHFHRRM